MLATAHRIISRRKPSCTNIQPSQTYPAITTAFSNELQWYWGLRAGKQQYSRPSCTRRLVYIHAQKYCQGWSMPELPKGRRVVSTKRHGNSFWAHTAWISIELVDGTSKVFLKERSEEVGKNIVHGEFESMKAIHSLLPDVCTKADCLGDISDHTRYFLFPLRVPNHGWSYAWIVQIHRELSKVASEQHFPDRQI